MTTEELNAIRATVVYFHESPLQDEALALCAEVERLQKLLAELRDGITKAKALADKL